MRIPLLTGAFVCALTLSSLAPRGAFAQDGLPFRTFGVPSITGTIGNTSLNGEKTIKLDSSGLLTVTDRLGTHTHSLTNAEAQNLVDLVNKADLKNVPTHVLDSAMIMGATSFDVKIKTADGHTYRRQGPALQDLAKYPGFEKLMESVDGLVVKAADLPPVAPVDPGKTDKFDKISIELENPWTQWKDFLTVRPDGTYTYTRGGPDVLAPENGKLTPAQFDAIKKQFDANTFKANDGKTVGGILPDDTLSTVTATVGGKDYTVHAYVDSQKLGPLAGLEKALVGDVNAVQPPVARPIVANDTTRKSDRGFFGSIGDFFSNVGSSVKGWFSRSNKSAPARSADAKDAADAADGIRGTRTAGLTGVLGGDIRDATDHAAGTDGGK